MFLNETLVSLRRQALSLRGGRWVVAGRGTSGLTARCNYRCIREHEPGTAAAPARRGAAHAVQPSRPGVAAPPFARRRAPEAIRVSVAGHAGALRGLPVAGPGDSARGRRGDVDPRAADRERRTRRRAAALPRAARP